MSTRKSMLSLLALLLVAMSMIAVAQNATGIITGTVSDESGAVVPNATVTITNKATGITRTTTTNAEGLYSAPALVAGEYEVRVEIQGFKTTVRPTLLQAGGDVQVNMAMSLGGTKDVVTVEGATTEVNYEGHQVQGVIERQTIQDLPMNGRSYIQLASIEPGVTVASGTTSQFNALFTVSVLGSGNRTRVHDRWRKCFGQHRRRRRHVVDELLAGYGPGIPDFDFELRYRDADRIGRRNQRGDALGQQRISRQRLVLLPRPQHGGVSEPDPQPVEPGSVLRPPQSGRLDRRADHEEQAVLLL